MPKRAVFERSRRELSLDVSVRVHILLVVEQSNLESQSKKGVSRFRYLRQISFSSKTSLFLPVIFARKARVQHPLGTSVIELTHRPPSPNLVLLLTPNEQYM